MSAHGIKIIICTDKSFTINIAIFHKKIGTVVLIECAIPHSPPTLSVSIGSMWTQDRKLHLSSGLSLFSPH